jgi:hypothetical protein
VSFREKVCAAAVWFAAGGLLVIGCLTGAVHPPALAKTAALFATEPKTPAARAVAIMEADWHIPVKHRPVISDCGCSIGKLPY